ncbi:MAG: CopG family transcriptional regulator [Acidobacteriota bacterium]
MAQVAIYIDNETMKRVDKAAKREGASRSAWVKKAVEERLRNRLPDSFFRVLGAWKDDRDADEILADIRSGIRETKRPELR